MFLGFRYVVILATTNALVVQGFDCNINPEVSADISKHAEQQALCKGYLDVTLPPYGP